MFPPNLRGMYPWPRYGAPCVQPVISLRGVFIRLNPIALRKAKIAYNFGLSECNRVNPVVAPDKPDICGKKKNIT